LGLCLRGEVVAVEVCELLGLRRSYIWPLALDLLERDTTEEAHGEHQDDHGSTRVPAVNTDGPPPSVADAAAFSHGHHELSYG
jgi:hypothetical protein